MKDVDNAGTTEQSRITLNLLRQYQAAIRKANPIEAVLTVMCDSLDINESKLSDEERKTLLRVMKKSKLLRAVPNRHRRKK